MDPKKTDIVNWLNARYRLRRFLEISTENTGLAFAEIDRSILDVCDRLSYRCPDEFDDGQTYTYRSDAADSRGLMSVAFSENRVYDTIFVDTYHYYRTAHLDLMGALALLAPGGVMVVHDCGPTDPAWCVPEFELGTAWCGDTYLAFIDVVLPRNGISYCTVDCDYGCGVVYKAPLRCPFEAPQSSDRLLYELDAVRDDRDARFSFYMEHRAELLNIVTPERFFAA